MSLGDVHPKNGKIVLMGPIMSSRQIRDKDKFRIAQENFELEGRADVMVRAAQSLTLLSHSLKLSLLFSQEPIDGPNGQTLDEEAISLIQSTSKSKEKCTRLIQELFDLGKEKEVVVDGPREVKTTTQEAESSAAKVEQQEASEQAQDLQAEGDVTMASED